MNPRFLISILAAAVFLASSFSPVFAIAASSYYTNVSGVQVHVPVQAVKAPKGASARCKDGSYSFSKHRSGTCSGHRGVAKWL
ncbi:DUF3761 domain-containing protein [Candidatus Parcubacteria bacterium]|nr:DUF3761 domain-containing protein [Candidatus Parcubacteria bacterium]